MSVDTTKTINLAQLDEETGGGGLHRTTVGDTCEIVSLDGVSDADLQTAIDAHVAGPDDTRTVDEKLAQAGLTVDELRSALGL